MGQGDVLGLAKSVSVSACLKHCDWASSATFQVGLIWFQALLSASDAPADRHSYVTLFPCKILILASWRQCTLSRKQLEPFPYLFLINPISCECHSMRLTSCQKLLQMNRHYGKGIKNKIRKQKKDRTRIHPVIFSEHHYTAEKTLVATASAHEPSYTAVQHEILQHESKNSGSQEKWSLTAIAEGML